jgi:hypothetical protein
MPICKPQSLRSLTTISLQPDKISCKHEVMMYMEIAGRTGKDIAAATGLSESRVSIVRNSPLYKSGLESLKNRLRDEVVEKGGEKLSAGDPVEEALHGAALEAARVKIDLMANAESEFVRSSAAGDVLDRAGYKSHQEKTKVTIEVTEKMSERWERALKYEHTTD